jgi:ribosomal protein S18 acetylase RimI-like enzyme
VPETYVGGLQVALRVRIRPAQAGDHGFIRELGLSAFSEYSLHAAREVMAMANRGRTFVADEGDRPVGFVVLEPERAGTVHVSAIAVFETARGRGVGRTLLEHAEAAARAAGARALSLVTADGNLAALELFLRCGFRRVHRSDRYYARGQPGIALNKAL